MKTRTRLILGVPAGIFATVALVVVLALGGLAWRWLIAEPTGAVEAREQTIGDGSYRIAAYDSFYDKCNSALALQQNIDLARDQLATAPPDPGRQAQLQANVTALEAQLNRAVADYNADVAKADTRGHFLASDLPYSLDTHQEIRCAA